MGMMSKTSSALRRFQNDESGTTLVELAICISLFLLILFAILDFGILGYNWVTAEKGMQIAVRIAAVRPPVCDEVPLVHLSNPGNSNFFKAGTLCSTNGGICAQIDKQCLLSEPAPGNASATATADEIWSKLEVLLPAGALRSNVLLSYEYDPRLGFIGGPYIPIITARLVGSEDGDSPNGYGELPFQFVTPLSALAAQAGASDVTGIPGTIPFPGIEVTLPAEDMNQGVQG